MVPGAAGFLEAQLQVPHDASVLDMVFSDSGGGSGGFYDSNHGLEYHIPLRGSRVPQPSLSICHISVEMAPICKVSQMPSTLLYSHLPTSDDTYGTYMFRV